MKILTLTLTSHELLSKLLKLFVPLFFSKMRVTVPIPKAVLRILTHLGKPSTQTWYMLSK